MIVILALFFALSAKALDPNDAKALQQTQGVLTDKSQRDGVIKKSPDAKKADDYAHSVGGAHTEEIYGLASKVFEKLVQKYNGDAKKIAEVLERAKTDPAGFANSEFSADELSALKALSVKLDPVAPSGK